MPGLAALVTLLVACASAPPTGAAVTSAAAPPALPSPVALPSPAALPTPAALPFIEDDYARALSAARAANKPLFVDAWAPWCHSCLSMRAFTFRDAKVRAHAGEFVWASIDTENAVNAKWVETHPTHAMPTLFVVDPKSGGNVLEWPSSATADELVKLMEEARAALASGQPASGEQRAVAWPGEATALEAKLDALNQKKDFAACAAAADRELPKITRGAGRPITLALACIGKLPKSDARAALLERTLARARAIAADATDPMLPDDRSSLYEEMVDVLDEDGRAVESKDIVKAWAAFLEGEAARAPDPEARAVFDAHRVDAYVELGEPERAVPMLEASARDFPKDYNPPARLARAYLALKRYDEALASIDHALSLAYGPRTLRLLALKAEILQARKGPGDRASALATLKDALHRADAQPLAPRYAPVRADLERRLKSLEGTR